MCSRVRSNLYKRYSFGYLISLKVGPIQSIVSYGIGSMNDNLITQYQLAYALALRKELGINGTIEIFDPSMGKVSLCGLAVI